MSPRHLLLLRDRLGLTQEALAQLVGVSYASVNRWERGHNTLSRGPALILLRALFAASTTDGAVDLATWHGQGPNYFWHQVFSLASGADDLRELGPT